MTGDELPDVTTQHTCTPDIGAACIPCGISPERAAKGKRMITRQQVLSAVDAIVAREGDATFSLRDVVAELGVGLNSERHVRNLLNDMPDEIRRRQFGRRVCYERFSDAMRAAWREADELASVLGGESIHYVREDQPATITLTINQARTIARIVAAHTRKHCHE